MDKQEKRFIRRDLINFYIHQCYHLGFTVSAEAIKECVRFDEVLFYRRSLRLYYPMPKG